MSKEIVILVGAPGSGKSSYAETLRDTHYRISQDDQGKEGHWNAFLPILATGNNILIDRMNFNKQQRERYLESARKVGYRTKIVVFHVPSAVCRERAVARIGNHPTILTEQDADKAINFFFSKYERVEDNEADEVVRLGWDGPKKDAIICDLDGTLCNIEHRLHHVRGPGKKNWKAFCDEIPNDKPNLWCAKLINRYLGQADRSSNSEKVVFCSGRSDEYRKVTETWLHGYCFYNYEGLYMRRRGDSRADYIAKEIILDFELLTRYNILFAIDDRQQVVDLWRRRGLVALQCSHGDF